MILHADARHLPLRDGCVQCVVTSPPYWGLRDYGVGAQIGMESTPDAYVAALVGVFREVRRVLKDDGVCWLNLGDSYFGGGTDGGQFSTKRPKTRWAEKGNRETVKRGLPHPDHGLKFKDLVGIPWRLALALQQPWFTCEMCDQESHGSSWLRAPDNYQEDDRPVGFCPCCCGAQPMQVSTLGWYLRSDIIWSKPNPMPESVTDRPTKSHEYLFLLSKSERYHYDSAAIREPYAASTLTQFHSPYTGQGTKDYESVGVQNPSDIKRRITDKQRGHSRRHAGFNDRWDAMPKDEQQQAGANKRSVWNIATMPYRGAHFATMPEALVEPCILAGCPVGGLVLDPFLGSGTVGAVAERLSRRWVGCDLNPAYHQLAKKRTAQRGIRFHTSEAIA